MWPVEARSEKERFVLVAFHQPDDFSSHHPIGMLLIRLRRSIEGQR